jgi:folylpolyglutamate synthase/dihydropteroate synthase
MLPPLLEDAEVLVLTRPRSSRSRNPHEIASSMAWFADVRVVDNPLDALDAALETRLSIVVCGSIYLVGDVRRDLRRRFGTPDQI